MHQRKNGKQVKWAATGHILAIALKEARAQSAYRRLLLSWPSLKNVAQSFCAYFTELVPAHDHSETLITSCLREGVHAGDRLVRIKRTPAYDPQVFRATVAGLLRNVPFAYRWVVHDTRSGDQWDIFNSGPLQAWRREYAALKVAERDDNPPSAEMSESIRLAVALKILSQQDVVVLDGGIMSLVSELAVADR